MKYPDFSREKPCPTCGLFHEHVLASNDYFPKDWWFSVGQRVMLAEFYFKPRLNLDPKIRETYYKEKGFKGDIGSVFGPYVIKEIYHDEKLYFVAWLTHEKTGDDFMTTVPADKLLPANRFTRRDPSEPDITDT